MKKVILLLCVVILYNCSQQPKINTVVIQDGFYEVIKLVSDTTQSPSCAQNQILLSFDTLFNPGDFTKVLIDTSDFVPLELDETPEIQQQTADKKLLSISLAPKSTEIIKAFTAKRIMKEVVVVLDGKAITMHKIRDTISGDKMQITRCGDNACEYLYIKMKNKVKH